MDYIAFFTPHLQITKLHMDMPFILPPIRNFDLYSIGSILKYIPNGIKKVSCPPIRMPNYRLSDDELFAKRRNLLGMVMRWIGNRKRRIFDALKYPLLNLYNRYFFPICPSKSE